MAYGSKRKSMMPLTRCAFLKTCQALIKLILFSVVKYLTSESQSRPPVRRRSKLQTSKSRGNSLRRVSKSVGYLEPSLTTVLGMTYLRRYFSLIIFQAYLRSTQPDTVRSFETFENFIKSRPGGLQALILPCPL